MVIFGGFGAGKGVVWERGQPIASAAFHPKNDPCYGLTPFSPFTKANAAWKQLAADRNAKLRGIVTEIMEVTRLSKLGEIANALNLRGIRTNRGCQFTATQIHRLLKAA